MHIRTCQAVVWADRDAEAARRHPRRRKRIQRRAVHPLHTREGLARWLRFDGEVPEVLVGSPGRWVPLARVATKAQAEHWIRTGFPREGRRRQGPDAGP